MSETNTYKKTSALQTNKARWRAHLNIIILFKVIIVEVLYYNNDANKFSGKLKKHYTDCTVLDKKVIKDFFVVPYGTLTIEPSKRVQKIQELLKVPRGALSGSFENP